MDGKKHELFIGPVFPIKKEAEIIEEDIRLTMCFKDIKQGYYVDGLVSRKKQILPAILSELN